MNDFLLRSAYSEHRKGNLEVAIRLYSELLRSDPRQADALCLLGMAQLQRGDLGQAQSAADEALKQGTMSGAAFHNLGCLLQSLGRHEEARASFDRALIVNPYACESLVRRGMSLLALNDPAGALASLDRSLSIRPGDPDALAGRSIALYRLKRLEEALASLDRALAIAPLRADTWFHRAKTLLVLQRYEEALASADRCLAAAPEHFNAHVCRGVALWTLGAAEEAVASCERALALNPDCVEASANRSTYLFAMQRHEEAASECERALAIDPAARNMLGQLAFYRLRCCDWRDLDGQRRKIAAGIAAGKPVIAPFHNFAISRSPADQLSAARIFAEGEYPPARNPLWRGERYAHSRIRLAYVSADFRNHPLSFLMAGVFEHHDKGRFETIAISFAPREESAMRARLTGAFERFVDAEGERTASMARLLRELEADIAVDLTGFTTAGRPGIFAQRPAPVQVNYLGFPGTMGAPYYDYILADKVAIPEAMKPHFAEKIAYLPDTYLPHDRTQAIAERVPSRAEAGLPESAFVFACFNNSYKFLPETFAVWMRLLCAVPESVLWLAGPNEAAARNLRREAEARGVAGARLVFAPFLPERRDHLARLKLADLFLDTLPYNAHATACDALWAGLPVLTCIGTAFAGRVAASALHAAGLPELIADSPEDYEALALSFARDPGRLARAKEKLAGNRDTQPLFDTARFTRHLEAAFAAMWERSQRGLPPESFAVDAAAPGRAV